MTSKKKVLQRIPTAVCVKCSNPKGYLVWKSKHPGQRGVEAAAIGYGKSPETAWNDALISISGKQRY